MLSVATFGYWLAVITHGLLVLWIVGSGRRVLQATVAALAAAASFLWALFAALRGPPVMPVAPDLFGAPVPVFGGALLVELDFLRLGLWAVLPLVLLSRTGSERARPWILVVLMVAGAIAATSGRLAALPDELAEHIRLLVAPLVYLALALYGLSLLEATWSRADPGRRRALTLLCLSLCIQFGLEFFALSDALLYRRPDPDLWGARGYVAAVASVPIAIALAAAPERAMRRGFGRRAVTGSVLLLLAGCYLLLVAGAGYLVRLVGVPGLGPLPIVISSIAVVTSLAMLASGTLRARVRVTLAKHLFRYKYDYRDEWLRFTHALTRPEASTPQAILTALTTIVDSDSGSLWGGAPESPLTLLAERGASACSDIESQKLDGLRQFMQRTGWLIDLDEYRRYPQRYSGLTLPGELTTSATAWLVVPLPHRDSIVGVALIGRSPLLKRIDWEDRDLLKTAGHQAAGQLALFLANAELAEARQFEAFNKASTYVMHDLKNILGQQSLIVANADRHRHKPEFIDDMVTTVENSVQRMRSLLEQLEQRKRERVAEPVPLAHVLDMVLERGRGRLPEPELELASGADPKTLYVVTDAERLVRVVGHLVQNAQEACGARGEVTLRLHSTGDRATLEVIDTGTGMSPDFLRDELFRPFSSTKGLTGMGIGAHEAREYLRFLGGRLDVSSTVGQGTVFTMDLPLWCPQTNESSGGREDV